MAQPGSQDCAGAIADAARQSNHSLPGSAKQDWVQQTIKASSQDARRQPWKKHFASTVVESRIDDGPDLVVIKKPRNAAGAQNDDDDDDDSCPFQIQGSSLAA